MVEKIIVNPLNVRGHGNVVSSKTVEDFTTYNSSLSFEDSFYTMEFTESAITLSLVVSSGTVSVGEAVTCTATVLDNGVAVPNVSVRFFDGNSVLGTVESDSNGVAELVLSTLSAGSHSIIASYGGQSSSAVSVTVNKLTTSISLSSNKASCYIDETFTLSGTLSRGEGYSVYLYNGTVLVDTLTTGTDGAFTKTVTPSATGTFNYSVRYNGDSTYEAVTSSTVTVTVSSVAPSYDDIVLTADDSILSYYDGDSTTLRAQLMDGTSTASVSGVTVEFFNGSTSLGTAQTDSNGVATKTYTSTGVGDISLTASDGTLVSVTYTIHDYYWYSNSEYSSLTTLNNTLPSAFKVSFEFKPTSRSNASSYVEIGTSTTNCFVIGQITSGGLCGVWERVNNNYSTTNPFQNNSTLNAWQEMVFSFDGTDWTCTLNGETITNSLDVSYDLTTLLRTYPISNNHLRNIRVIKL